MNSFFSIGGYQIGAITDVATITIIRVMFTYLSQAATWAMTSSHREVPTGYCESPCLCDYHHYHSLPVSIRSII